MTKKYEYTNVRVDESHYDAAEKAYNGKADTKYNGSINFQLKYFDVPKETKNGAFIYADIFIPGLRFPVGIFENDDTRTGGKRYSGSAKDDNRNLLFYINIKKILTASKIPSYEVVFVEPVREEEDVKEDDELPFE